MTLGIIAVCAIVVIIAGAFLFFSVAKRILRLAVRLTMFFALTLIVLVGGALLYWFGTDHTKPSRQENRPTNSRRGNSR